MIDNKWRERGGFTSSWEWHGCVFARYVSQMQKKIICFDMIKHLVTHLKLDLHLIIFLTFLASQFTYLLTLLSHTAPVPQKMCQVFIYIYIYNILAHFSKFVLS